MLFSEFVLEIKNMVKEMDEERANHERRQAELAASIKQKRFK